MRRVLLLGIILCTLAGCKKDKNKTTPSQSKEGSGGAIQDVRKAVNRTVALNDLQNLRIFIDNASGANGKMPTVAEITESVKSVKPLAQAIKDGSLILTGTKSREGIWAYTADAQTPAGEHLVVTASEITRMDLATLKQRLGQ